MGVFAASYILLKKSRGRGFSFSVVGKMKMKLTARIDSNIDITMNGTRQLTDSANIAISGSPIIVPRRLKAIINPIACPLDFIPT